MAQRMEQLKEMFGSHALPCGMEEISTGTSIVACEFKGGVVLGADSRTSTSTYVANRVSDKITRVTNYIYCCRSGSAADTQAIADVVAYHLQFYASETGEEPLVKTAAALFKELIYNYREEMVAGIIVAGWDKVHGGQVYIINLGGMLVRQNISIGGSGSSYVYGYVDANYKEGFSEKEAKAFVANTLSLAMCRDGSSGGVIRLASISQDGVKRDLVTGESIPRHFSQKILSY